MKAQLKRIISPDIFDLSDFIPKEDKTFSILLQLIVGPLNGEGEESFDVLVCTPNWLIDNHDASDLIVGRHYLIAFEYNYQKLYNKLKELVESFEAETWEELGNYIGRIGKWEFEDYKD